MNLSEEVDLEDYVARPDKINNAEIASICQVGELGCRGVDGSYGEVCRSGTHCVWGPGPGDGAKFPRRNV